MIVALRSDGVSVSGIYQISIKLCLGPGIIPIRLLLGLGFSYAKLAGWVPRLRF